MKLILSILLFTILSFSNPTRFLSPNALKLGQSKSKINSDNHELSTEVKFPIKRKANSINPGLNHKDKLQRKILKNPKVKVAHYQIEMNQINWSLIQISQKKKSYLLIYNANEPEKKSYRLIYNTNEPEKSYRLIVNPNEPDKSSLNLNNPEKDLEDENPVAPISQDDSNYSNHREIGQKGGKTNSSNYYSNYLYLLLGLSLLILNLK